MLIAPTPAWRSEILTFSLEGSVRDCERTSIGSRDVGLQDDREVLDPAFLDLAEELLEREPRGGGHRLLAVLQLAERRRSSGPWLRPRRPGRCRPPAGRSSKPVTSTGVAGPRLGDLRPAVVLHRTHAAEDRAREEDVSDLQACRPGRARWRRCRAPLRGGPRGRRRAPRRRPGAVSSPISATRRMSSRRWSMPCFLIAEISADGRVAAPGLEQHALVGELLLDAVEVGVGLVDLVDRDDDRHLRGARVVDRLDRLRHDAVVGGDDEDDDVRRPRAPGAHRREGLVAGRVEEDDRLVLGPRPGRRRCAA